MNPFDWKQIVTNGIKVIKVDYNLNLITKQLLKMKTFDPKVGSLNVTSPHPPNNVVCIRDTSKYALKDNRFDLRKHAHTQYNESNIW